MLKRFCRSINCFNFNKNNCFMRKTLACRIIPVCIIVLLILFSATTYAQKTVRGTVTGGANNQPISGASVLITGTTTGTTTDVSGAFSLNVPTGKNTLVISSIGYNETEVDITNQTSISVSLKDKTSTLD